LNKKGVVEEMHSVDVVHFPEQGNYSHSLVKTAPAVASDGAFKRLKEALARIAQSRDWAYRPHSLRR
jgi:hypothetical protein